MKTILEDGRIFETKPFLEIQYNPKELVYKFKFVTDDRIVTSSPTHLWAVWDKKTKDICMKQMDVIDINMHELLIQGWK